MLNFDSQLNQSTQNTELDKKLNHSSFSETIYEDNSSIKENTHQDNTRGLNYHAKQWGKGLLVSGVALLGYVGLRSFFGSKLEDKTLKGEPVVDSNNLASPLKKLIDIPIGTGELSSATSSAVLSSRERHAIEKTGLPSFSTSRTLLSLQEKEAGQSSERKGGRTQGFITTDKKTFARASNRRAALNISYAAGPEFQINTYTTSNQELPVVAALPAGGFVVVWQSLGQDGSDYGVYGQCYNATGGTVGPEFQVNTYTTSGQLLPKVAALPAGGFVVVWTSNGQDASLYGVYGQRYNTTGGTVGPEFQVNAYTTSSQGSPVVKAFPTGGFVVVWSSQFQDGDGYGVYGQRYLATGGTVGPEFKVNTYTTSYQLVPAVAALSAGGFVVVWQSDGQDGSGSGVYGQRYLATGGVVGPEFQVNTYTASGQSNPAVAALPAGGFVVVWQSNGQDGSNRGIFGQRYNVMGGTVGPEFQVNTYTALDQQYSAVTALPAGGFVVTWMSDDQDGSNRGIFGQRFNAMGGAVEPEFQVNSYTSSYQSFPTVVALPTGAFVVVWESFDQDSSNYGVYGRIFSPPPSLSNDALIIGIITGSILGGACLCLTASAILFILPTGIWVAKQKQSKITGRNTVEDISEQKTELKEISDITEKQVGSEHKQPTVTSTQKGFFQPPKANPQDVIELQTNKQDSSAKENNKEQTKTLQVVEFQKMVSNDISQAIQPVETSTSENESEGDELTFVTSEEITLKSCDNLTERESMLLAWGEKYSASNDTLLVYQQDTKEWFICGKNSEENVTNEKLEFSSALGKMLQSKSLEEIAKIDSEKLQDTALDYLGYEDESTEEDPSADDSQPRVSF